jgi:hypothetical protein
MITIILFEENFDHDTLYFASDLLSGKHKKKAIRELFHGLRDSRFVRLVGHFARLGRPFRTVSLLTLTRCAKPLPAYSAI